jgi:hydrogenase maturation factor
MHKKGENSMRLPFGKIPPEILESHVFSYLGANRNDVILGPARGEDASLVKTDDVLIASSSDPISGAIRWIGHIAVHISANDVSTLGVKPRWFNSCIMLPETSGIDDLKCVSRQIHKAASELGVAIIGGHSEITPGLEHPLIVGFCMGIAEAGHYITSSGAKEGGKIILTKGVAIEGTAIICTDKSSLVKQILGEDVQQRGAEYISDISIVREALAAFHFGGVQAMHDPTEGGVAGGLHEVGDASHCGFRIYEEKLIIKPETEQICSSFGIDPLRLISSGTLLVVVDNEKAEDLLHHLKSLKLDSSIIGEIVADSTYRKLITSEGREDDLTRPDSDELWRALVKDRHDFDLKK